MILTVVLPVYNAMPYLPAAVESILEQTYGEFEFLIADDDSTDGSTEYLRSLRDPRINLTVHQNRGLGATLNELFRNSRTKYVARMDADDVCDPRRLEKQMRFLYDHEEVVMLGAGIDFMVGNHFVNGFLPLTKHDEIRDRLLQKRPGVNHPTIIVRRDAWEGVGGYHLSRNGEDLDFCLRLCDFGRVSNIPEVLYHYRLHRGSVTLKKPVERNRGYSFAVACARAREQGIPQPELRDFELAWNERSTWARLDEFVSGAGEYLYRTSIIHRAEGRFLLSRACLLAAAVCLPRAALSRLIKPQSERYRITGPVPRR
jgi:glycosyltransferase involved in cell wall biosynthesis